LIPWPYELGQGAQVPRLRLVTPPAEEPVTIADAKVQLGVPQSVSAHDSWLTSRIAAARQRCEAEIRCSFVSSGWELSLHGFPIDPRLAISLETIVSGSALAIELPTPPLISVESISYLDVAGVRQTMSPSAYTVLPGSPGLVVPAYGTNWPTHRRYPGSVLIDFTAGYGAASAVPDCIKAAILVYLTWLFEKRGDENADLPQAVKDLLAAEDPGVDFG
jgi:uncharacterized phiE125 gp8 family phage protein